MLLLSLITGCFSEANYAEEYWATHCERLLECYGDDSSDALSYSDLDACLEYNAQSIADTRAMAEAEDCSYDAVQAQTCIDEVASSSCDEFLSDDAAETCSAVCAP